MIAIDIPYREDDPKSIRMDEVPASLQYAIDRTVKKYPTVQNKGKRMRFDRLFEKLYNCKIEYNDFNGISRIVWADDRDYVMFLLQC